MSLNGKHALVTGGGTGIGLAIARMLVEEGARVTITGRRLSVLQEAAGDGLFPAEMDVRDETQVCDVIAQAVNARGPIAVCVPNAGIAEGRSVHKMDMEFWRNMMATNLDGAFLTIRESLHSMRAAGWGRVIAVASVAGLRGAQGAACYTATKHGMVGLIRALSEDYLGSEITCNALCPAYVDTEIVSRNSVSIASRAGITEDQAHKMLVSANRHKRLISPDEIAAAARWLVRPGSQSVNGQAIEIGGGQM